MKYGAPKKAGHGQYSRKGSLYKWQRKGKAYSRIKGSADPAKLKEYRRKRAAKKQPAPYDPLQPLAGKDFDTEVQRNVRLKYGGQAQQLQGERRISNVQQRNIGDWFGQYQKTLQGAQAATAQGYNLAQQGVYNQANRAGAQDEATRQRLAAEAQQQASLRGTSASADPDAAKAAMARGALSNSFGGLIGAQGASQQAYAGAIRGAGAAARVGAHLDEAKRRRQIEGLGRDLQREAGDYASGKRGELRDTERKYALERQAFGLQVEKAQTDAQTKAAGQKQTAKDKRASRRLTRRQQNISLRGQNLTEADRQWRRDHPGQTRGGPKGPSGGPEGLTPSKRRAYKDKWEGYVGNIRAGKKFGSGSIPSLVRAANEYEQNKKRYGTGFVSKATARRIRAKYGFSIRHRKPKTPRGAVGDVTKGVEEGVKSFFS